MLLAFNTICPWLCIALTSWSEFWQGDTDGTTPRIPDVLVAKVTSA